MSDDNGKKQEKMEVLYELAEAKAERDCLVRHLECHAGKLESATEATRKLMESPGGTADFLFGNVTNYASRDDLVSLGQQLVEIRKKIETLKQQRQRLYPSPA